MHKAYLISGLSGVGKTTLGRYIEQTRRDVVFVDQDAFFHSEKPFITLSGGWKVKNWDCCEALDWKKLNNELSALLDGTDIVLVGFCLRDDCLPALKDRIYSHVELIYEKDEKNRCKEARARSKIRIDGKKDSMVVDHLVWPFYLETRQKSTIDARIIVFEGENRRAVDEIYKEWTIRDLSRRRR